MRIVLVGVPDIGKQELAKEQALLLNNTHSRTIDLNMDTELSNLFPNDPILPAVGFLSDYRTELLLASHRSVDMVLHDNKVFTHSVIDSLAYAMAIISIKVESKSDDLDQWFTIFNFLPTLIADSFMYDKVIYLPYKGDDKLFETLNKNLKFLLENYSIPYEEKE